MSSLAAAGQPIDLLSQSATSYAPRRVVTRDVATIDRTAKAFEASFLTTMFNSMFEGLSTAPPFGGGEGEQAFRSFLSEAMAKQVVKHGGVGVAQSVRREMLKMQGLQDPAAPAVAAAPAAHKE
ncbi:MAG: rod-binding protein [Pseudomonadota bacterium]|jgi:flagellar protein FlgJ